MSEENKALVRRWVEECQSQHRLEVMEEMFAPDMVNHDAPSGLPSPQGLEGVRQFFEMIFAAFPDFRAVVHDQIAEGDKVVTRKMVSGTHLGGFLGMPASGKYMEFQVIDIIRVVNGKFSDHWSVQDQLGMMQQLGVIPTPDQPAQ